MQVTVWPLEKIIPFARNARKIPPRAIDKVAASIQEFGWRVPIVVDKDGVIICGHTRLLAARKLGLTEAPVHVADNLTPAQVRAYRLLDNRSHEESTWDLDLLGLELLDLKNLGLDLELTGFDFSEIDELLARANGAGLSDEEAVPDLPETPSVNQEISGCLASIDCCVATPLFFPTTISCWRATPRPSRLPTRRTESTMRVKPRKS